LRSLCQGIALSYSMELFSTSIINFSLSKILQSGSLMPALGWKFGQTVVLVRLCCPSCSKAGELFRFTLSKPTAEHPPHRPENEAFCGLKTCIP